MSEFEKEFDKIIWNFKTAADIPLWYLDEIKFLKSFSKYFYLVALKWLKTQERITDGEYNVIDVRVIDKEIAANEKDLP